MRVEPEMFSPQSERESQKLLGKLEEIERQISAAVSRVESISEALFGTTLATAPVDSGEKLRAETSGFIPSANALADDSLAHLEQLHQVIAQIQDRF